MTKSSPSAPLARRLSRRLKWRPWLLGRWSITSRGLSAKPSSERALAAGLRPSSLQHTVDDTMTWLNAAFAFVFFCNLVFMIGAGMALFRILETTERSQINLQNAASHVIDAGTHVKVLARRAFNEMERTNDVLAARERSSGRTVAKLSFQIKTLLDRLHGAGWLLGVATGKSDRGLDLCLRHHGLRERFVTLQTADRHPSKPHPSMVYLAMTEAGASPEITVMIGDTSYDMLMARDAGVRQAGRIAATGVRTLMDTFVARIARGAGRFAPDKMMYFGEMALADLEGVDLMVLVETVEPVAFFAYPDRPSLLAPEGCETASLCGRDAAVRVLSAYLDQAARQEGPGLREGLATLPLMLVPSLSQHLLSTVRPVA